MKDRSTLYIIYAPHAPTRCLWLAGRSLGRPRGTLNILLETEKSSQQQIFLHADAQNDAGITLQLLKRYLYGGVLRQTKIS